jgi:hypothetical protein
MALAGVSDVYSASNDLFRAFLGIDVSASQVYRVSNVLGNQIDLDLQGDITHPALVTDEVIYASMDGSMVFTDEGWQEVKVGRVFSSQSRAPAGRKGDTETRFSLDKSTYCAHLGSVADFIPVFEASLGSYKSVEDRLVFVTDGGVWIEHYLARSYPKATHILDYYHAVEHLAAFSKVHFTKAKLGSQWLDKQCACLLNDGVDEVLLNVTALGNLSSVADESRRGLIGYYSRNRHRMQYGSFRDRGLQIGSGPMEAAHRTVVQCRMKRSGQRWSVDGAQAMLNLRVASKSGRWALVTDQLGTA